TRGSVVIIASLISLFFTKPFRYITKTSRQSSGFAHFQAGNQAKKFEISVEKEKSTLFLPN
ncbi:hypothetical protein, partial [Lactobacillus kefiranofaciens]|uniref:hypothetical protein n=1 Tax=Lactobacillus kefiranofaciens TaxID=267818 RepID=UPI000A421CB6